MAETGKKGKKKKGRTVNLNEFLAKDAESGSAVGAAAVFAARSTNWADESEGLNADVDNAWPEESYGGGNKVRAALDRAALPTAPRASRCTEVDTSKVPKDPPYTAFLGNLSYDVEREDVFEFFKDTKVTEVRLPQDPNGRLKGFGYAEFEDRQSLVAALDLNNEQLKNRRIRVDVAGQQDKDGGGGGGSRTHESNRSELDSDWRRSSDNSSQSNGFMNDRGGGYDAPRDRGFGDDRQGPPRDRGFGGDRYGGDRYGGDKYGGDRYGGDRYGGDRYGGDRYGGDRYGGDRYGGDRYGGDRSGGSRFGGDRYGGDRYEGGGRYGPPRDRYGGDRGYRDDGPPRDRYERDEGYGPPRDRQDRYGDRDGGGRGFGGSWGPRNQDRSDDRGYGRDQGGDRYGDRDRGYGRRDMDRDFERESAPKERPKLQLQPRSKPREESTQQTQSSVRSPSIFGNAKPVDTAAKEREIEEKLARQKLEDELMLKEEREKRESRDIRDTREFSDSHDRKDEWKRGRRDSNRSSDGDKPQRERHNSHQSNDGERDPREPRSNPGRGRKSSEEGRESGPRAAAKDSPPKEAPPPTENVWAKRLESRKAGESVKTDDREQDPNKDVSPKKVTTPPASSGRGVPTSPSGRGGYGRDGAPRGRGRGVRGRPSADGPGHGRGEKKEKRERRPPEIKKYEEPNSPVFHQQSKFALLVDEQEENDEENEDV